MEYIKLVNGMTVPAIGTGTNSFGKCESRVTSEYNGDFSPVGYALKAGYRMFDSAIMYGNEDGLGTALKENGIKRDELILIDKLKIAPGYIENAEAVKNAVKSSLLALKTDYIDFYLLHKPWDNEEQMLEAWNALNDLVKEGCIRATAVSNFNAEKIRLLTSNTGYVPAFNQHAYNSTNWNLTLVEDMKKISVPSMAYAPLNLSVSMKEKLSELAVSYGKTWSQMLLRHNYQKGMVSIPKSHKYEHALTNISIFDFEINLQDMKKIDDFIVNDPLIDKKTYL